MIRDSGETGSGNSIHLAEQIERPLQHVGKIENRSILERLAVLRERDANIVDAPCDTTLNRA